MGRGRAPTSAEKPVFRFFLKIRVLPRLSASNS
jgi:hypothetical protein